MKHFEITPQHEFTNTVDFKQQCLAAFREQLACRAYPGYPSFRDRFFVDRDDFAMEPVHLPDGPWETSNGALPSIREQQALAQVVSRFDRWGRPLHPWFDQMAEDPVIGVVTGKGFYWNWGPNYTADAVVLRHDLDEPHVLLIQRADTGQWALPGGFIDPGEDALTASVREAHEEALIDLRQSQQSSVLTYSGPLADLRTTANAWPETTVFRFDLPTEMAQRLPLQYTGSLESPIVSWMPVRLVDDHLFGSHRQLLSTALVA